MTATKQWQCHRCNGQIKPGEMFDIVDGDFLCEDCATNPVFYNNVTTINN